MAEDKKQPIIIKKKKGGHGGHHGGAWKIAYADFVTAMMAFFLVMWIIGMDIKTKQGIASYFQNLSARATHNPASPFIVNLQGAPPVRPQPEPVKPRDSNLDKQAAKMIAQQIESMIAASPQLERLRGNVSVEIGDREMRIELADTVSETLFIAGGTQLRPEARRLIEGVAVILQRYRSKFVIEGHSEARGASGGTGQNLWELSTGRAVSVRGALAAAGISDERILEVKGLGDTRLKRRDDPLSPANRRVSIVAPYDIPE
ncbi:MAG: flagellar motor protein MotB [Planctomycetota bacterium]|nr:OmpA family protein [Planctomycetota bacterium]MDW8373224.1 flagellar motor protein MotB [Planctomycetota bacterium]